MQRIRFVSLSFMQRVQNTKKVEEYLNSIKTDRGQVKTVYAIATAIGMSEEAVRDVLIENGYGWNGITF